MFLANYSDVLTDAPLPDMIAQRAALGSAASMMLVRASGSFHTVTEHRWGTPRGLSTADNLTCGVNGGYFVLTHEGLRPHPPGVATSSATASRG